MNSSDDICNLLNSGDIPPELIYGINKPEEELINWDYVMYSALYTTREYWLSKFPQGFDSLPNYELILDKIIEKTKSPLEEYLEKNNTEIYKDGMDNGKPTVNAENNDISGCSEDTQQ